MKINYHEINALGSNHIISIFYIKISHFILKLINVLIRYFKHDLNNTKNFINWFQIKIIMIFFIFFTWTCKCFFCKRCYVYNIFTTNHKWLVIIGSNLKLILRLLFGPNNNLSKKKPITWHLKFVIKMLWKYCRHIISLLPFLGWE